MYPTYPSISTIIDRERDVLNYRVPRTLVGTAEEEKRYAVSFRVTQRCFAFLSKHSEVSWIV